MATGSANLLLRIGADATKAITEMRRLSGTVTSEVNRISAAGRTGFGQTATASDGMGASFMSSAKSAISMGTAAIGAATGLILFAKHATEAAAVLHDLSQQTGFQVETLSGLKNAADTSGSSIQSISTALGIFQKNMVAAQTAGSKMSGIFRSLNIDTKDNEKAVRDAFRALHEMESGANQTALAMQLFGRSGKDVLGVLKEMDGDLDKAIEKGKELGIIIGKDVAKAADEFNDQMTIMGKQLQAIGLTVSKFLMPILKGLMVHIGHLTMAFRGWGAGD